MKPTIVLAALLFLAGCGLYSASGPCMGFHKNQQACERASENALVIGKVKLGQSAAEVRQIMGKDVERREENREIESWGYLTDYATSLWTIIVFKNGLVAEIKQAR